MGKNLEQTLAVLNGLVGNYLARTHNGLATEMTFCGRAGPLRPDAAGLSAAFPEPSARVVVFVHGLMTTERIWQMPDGTDYGSLLERDLGWSAAYVRYNSGLPISDNGARLSVLLQQLRAAYPKPIEELVLIGYSMGGLVIRAACHECAARDHGWLARVRRIIYVGTPHLGAPAERLGKLTSGILRAIPNAYTRLIADVSDLRSEGIQDLGHATLREQDRAIVASPWDLRDMRHPVPLLPDIEHHLIAGSLWGDARLALLFGDAIVPVASATYRGVAEDVLPPERVHVLPGVSHVALSHHPAVYERIKATLEKLT